MQSMKVTGGWIETSLNFIATMRNWVGSPHLVEARDPGGF
jgi:hypothetical protein